MQIRQPHSLKKPLEPALHQKVADWERGNHAAQQGDQHAVGDVRTVHAGAPSNAALATSQAVSTRSPRPVALNKRRGNPRSCSSLTVRDVTNPLSAIRPRVTYTDPRLTSFEASTSSSPYISRCAISRRRISAS